MVFDKKVPLELKKTQEWFASIITRPINAENQMMPISPSGISMEEEAKRFIVPRPNLKADERIQIYNQQYWWRLLTILHDDFPLVTRLFGYYEFNQIIAFPYLVKYPPSHWSLEFLGQHLSKWVEEFYFADDKELVLNANLVDYAYRHSFFAAKNKPISFDLANADTISEQIMYLQPHVHLFKFDYNFFSFRTEMLKQDPDYWLEHDFPELEKGEFYFILYRNHQNFTLYDSISPVAYQILSHFRQGSSIDQICEWLENQDEVVCEEAASHMQEWFQYWAALHLLS